MSAERLQLTSADGHQVAIHHWPCETEAANGVVVWLHGMAEHGARYQPLARFLNAMGWHLYCPDHRGHGASISAQAPQGHFADQQGWEKVVGDAKRVVELARERHPHLPCVLGGHSMGSFIALAAAQGNLGNQLAGLVLCGSSYEPGFYYSLMQMPVKAARLRRGRKGTSPLIRKMTFDSWARKVPEPRTTFDWLSTVPEEVDRYIADPLCGFDCSTESWFQLIKGLRQIHSVTAMAELPEGLPILLLAGEADPMSNMGKGMMALESILNAMEQPVTAHFWAEARHEVLNDQCREEAHKAIAEWLQQLPS